MGVIIPIRHEEAQQCSNVKLWSFISLDIVDNGGTLYTEAVAASQPWEAADVWAQHHLDEDEGEWPLRKVWLSTEFRDPIIVSSNAMEMGLGIEPIEIEKVEVREILKGKERDVIVSSIVELRLEERFPGRKDIPDFGICRKLKWDQFDPCAIRKHRVAIGVWERKHKRSAEGLFLSL
jgi:hypothetical protein